MKHFITKAVLVSLMSVSSCLCFGQAVEPPYNNGFDTENDFKEFTVIDVTGDRKTWGYSGSEHAAMAKYSWVQPKDDWLVSPAIHLTAGKSYRFSFDTYCGDTSYPERLEAFCGAEPTVEGQTTKLIEPTVVNWNSKSKMALSATFTPKADGDYFFSIHAISDEFMEYLYVDNFSVKEMSHDTPAGVTSLTAVTAAKGQLPVTISFIAPKTNVMGQPLTELKSIKLLREGTLIHEFDNPQPGQSLSFDDTDAKDGVNHYQVYAENEAGESQASSTDCFVGNDKLPLPVADLKVTDHNDNTLTLSWKLPEVGVSGGYIDPETVKYRVTRSISGNSVELANDISTTQLNDTIDAYGQTYVGYTVYDYMPSSYNYQTTSLWTVVGKPYPAPFKESCNGGTLDMHPWVIQNYTSTGGWSIVSDGKANVKACDEDGGYLSFVPSNASDSCQLSSPKIAIKGTIKPTLSFYYYAQKDNSSRLHVGLAADGDDFQNVLDLPLADNEEGWKQVEIPLDSYIGNDYIRFAFTGVAAESLNPVLLDNIELTAKKEYDLDVTSVSWPDEMSQGFANTIRASISNKGAKTANNFSVRLLRDQDVIAEEKCANLAPSATLDVTFTDSVNGLQESAAIYQVAVDYDEDLEPSNNMSEFVLLNINHHLDYPLVSNAKASRSDGSVLLTWDKPKAYKETVESFENSADFAISGITPWIVRDFNIQPTITVGGGSYPNAGLPAAFMVFNPALANVGGTAFAPHSGNKVLAAFANTQGINDGWLVSPELSGEAQDITFYAKSANPDFPEYMEVWYSTASRQQSDFSTMADGFEIENAGWQKVTVSVPEGTRYFAIRCNSADCYALLIDDITYQSAAANAQIIGYNIYRDGKLLNSTPVKSLSFSDDSAPAESCKYGISTVYSTGESQQVDVDGGIVSGISTPRSASEMLTVSGNRLTTSAAPADVYNTVGVQVAHIDRNNASVTLPSGPYIVRMGGKSVKVLLK